MFHEFVPYWALNDLVRSHFLVINPISAGVSAYFILCSKWSYHHALIHIISLPGKLKSSDIALDSIAHTHGYSKEYMKSRNFQSVRREGFSEGVPAEPHLNLPRHCET